MITRRLLLSGLSAAPIAVFAHEGHDLSRIEAQLAKFTATEQGLAMRLVLTNRRDTTIRLEGISCAEGPVAIEPIAELESGAVAEVDALLMAEAWPGIFTIILDFGVAGFGPVTVIPT